MSFVQESHEGEGRATVRWKLLFHQDAGIDQSPFCIHVP
jgi:hypothetical protein